jgi:hypothetical protein
MRDGKLIAVLGIFLASNSFAKNCELLLENKRAIKVELRDIHPTQFAVGFRRVEEKSEKIRHMDKDKLHSYLKKRPVPLVIGPGGHYYAIDKHHLALALLQNGLAESFGIIFDDLSDMSPTDFWKSMIKNKYVYLKDENGDGPLSPEALPRSLDEMKDDPYRSLAASVREEGGFEKTNTAFSEFAWAEFFRDRITIESGDKGFKKAVSKGIELAQSKEASRLPGYIGNRPQPKNGSED